MVKITILSESKGKHFHNLLAFYDFKGTAVNDCECGKFIYHKHYDVELKEFSHHTTPLDHEELKNLKKALSEAI